MRTPVNQPRVTQSFHKYHEGTDYVSQSGDLQLITMCRGYVANKGFHSQGGNYIIIKHPWIDKREFETYYGHLAEPSKLQTGHWVNEGDVIGLMGRTGKTTGVHVHFETRLERGKVDAELFLDTYRLVSDVVRPAYVALYEVFLSHTPSEEDQRNFIKAGENFRREYGYVKQRLGL